MTARQHFLVMLVAAALGFAPPARLLAQDKPPSFTLRVAYLGKKNQDPPPLSLTEPILKDKGIQIDLLVNNAGLLHEDRFASIPLAERRSLRRRPGYAERIKRVPAMLPRMW